jgi:phosphatidylglycerol:prolipoprotein diacylglycerol transferase
VLTVLLYARRCRLDLLAALDNLLPVFALAYSLGRLGCLAAGCCGGRPTEAALSLYFPDEHGVWAHRYPTQIISSVFQLLLFLWLARARPWPAWLNRRGARAATYALLFCVERFTLEFLRADYRPLVGPFSLPHLWMLAGMAAVIGAVALPVLAHRRRPAQP